MSYLKNIWTIVILLIITILIIFGIWLLLKKLDNLANRKIRVNELNRSEVIINIDNSTFGFDEVDVSKGTKIIWVNNDNQIHTITSDNGFFGSGPLKTNDSFEYTFDQTGNFPYHSTPQSMKSAILVK